MTIEFNHKSCDVIKDVYIIEPNSFKDDRGKLWSSYTNEYFCNNLLEGFSVTHDKFASNKRNVLRGLHGDYTSWKLVTVVCGEVLQVYVDNRPESDTFLSHKKMILNDENNRSVLIPPGVGNGFLTLSETAVYNYKLYYHGKYKDYEEQFTLKWDDPRLNISWPVTDPILSKRDTS